MEFSDRESLHQLVDTLPETALEAVEQALQHLETWPLEMPRDFQKMREQAVKLLAERTARSSGDTGVSCAGVGSLMSSGSFTRDGDGVTSAHGSKGGTQVTIELRKFRGHELQIEKQLGVSEDKHKLLYALLIRGPDGKGGHREITFDIGEE